MKPGGISCREVVELVTAYLDGALSPEDSARVRAHLVHCDSCVRYVEQIRATARMTAAAVSQLEQRPDRDALLAAFRGIRRTADS
jgi:anti-sigma factor RsiW